MSNASIYDTFDKNRKEEFVKSIVPVAKSGIAVPHKIKVKMPASEIKEWGLLISDWGGLNFSREK